MLTRCFEWIEARLNAGAWFRRGIVTFTLYMTFRLTNWGASFALTALASKADLVGTAGVITAVAGIPLGILTLIFNKYVDSREPS